MKRGLVGGVGQEEGPALGPEPGLGAPTPPR
jgi:hypothetical protein